MESTHYKFKMNKFLDGLIFFTSVSEKQLLFLDIGHKQQPNFYCNLINSCWWCSWWFCHCENLALMSMKHLRLFFELLSLFYWLCFMQFYFLTTFSSGPYPSLRIVIRNIRNQLFLEKLRQIIFDWDSIYNGDLPFQLKSDLKNSSTRLKKELIKMSKITYANFFPRFPREGTTKI